MRRKLFWGLLGAEALVCLGFCALQWTMGDYFTTIAAFPFEQIGTGLRLLSLTGKAGNGAAIFLYLAVSALPLGAMGWISSRRKLQPEDSLLVLETMLLLAGLYHMINPGGLPVGDSAAMIQMGKACYGLAIYSVLCGYLVALLLRSFYGADRESLQRYAAVLLGAMAVVFVYCIFGSSVSQLVTSLEELRGGNTGLGKGELLLTEVFLAVKWGAETLPYVMDTLVALLAIELLEAMGEDRYSDKTLALAEKLTRLCGLSLILTLLAGVGINVAQVLCMKLLYNISVTLWLPVFSLGFVLAVLLVSRYWGENRQLKEENNLFV